MEIRVNKDIYSKQVLLKTAYCFSDRVYLHLFQDNQSWIIQWTNMPDQEVKPELFENELVSQQLREEILERTKDIRTLLLSRAFASSAINIESSDTKREAKNMTIKADKEEEYDAADVLKGWFDK